MAEQRRLAAILAADIAGYSALMGADDARTVRDLKGHQAVILPMIVDHSGRIIDTAGDGILAEFGSIVNAVECAVAVQKSMAERNATVEPTRQMRFRIGINLGDVIYDETRVYGDGVNIAARLEGIAEPGGICVSGETYGQVHRKLSLNFTDLGEHQLKNIAQPVHVYRVELGRPAGDLAPPKQPLALPDKPSIAVLPFTNMSGDPSQEYFSDGITEDIITDLSRFSDLFVIARNSSFQYKGKSPDIRQVGRELGVRYVLEGSIRRAGDRVRITAQLIDTATGAHRWAERYDRELKDVFGVQDEVARTIVAILAAHVNKAEAERTLLKPPTTWLAHDYYLRASATYGSFWSSFQVQELYDTRKLLENALSLDPNYARAVALLGDTYVTTWAQPLDSEYRIPSTLDRGLQLARKAVQLDPNWPDAHARLGNALIFRHEHDAAVREFEKALALNPNHTYARFPTILAYAGDYRRAIEVALTHMRLDPFFPPFVIMWLGVAHFMLKEYSEALLLFQECVSRSPNYRNGHLWLAATYVYLGHLDKGRLEAREVLRIEPAYTIGGIGKIMASTFKRRADVEDLYLGLRKAGLPEI